MRWSIGDRAGLRRNGKKVSAVSHVTSLAGGVVTLANGSRWTLAGLPVNRTRGVSIERVREIAPQPGPQGQFLSCTAFAALYGGSAGSGKSYALLIDAARNHKIPGWAGLILRRHSKDLTGGGSIYEKARKLFRGMDATFRAGGQYVDIRWPSGATLVFKHLDKANVHDYQGLEYAWIGIDEVTHLDFYWVRYLMTRMRTDCGTKPTLRMTCNPDPDHPLAEWVEPFLHEDGTADRSKSGVLRYWAVSKTTDRIVFGSTAAAASKEADRPTDEIKTFTFIAGLRSDNAIGVAANPEYESTLAVVSNIEEERLRRGNWKVRAETGGMLRRSRWGQTILRAPLSPILTRVRGWDRAGTLPHPGTPNPDFTAGLLVYWDAKGRMYIAGLEACREEPPEVDRLMAATAADDGTGVIQAIEQDPGQAGKAESSHTISLLREACPGVDVRTSVPTKNKVIRAQPIARELERGMPRAEDTDPWEPIAYILDETGWTDERYSDSGDAPPTKIALFWSMVSRFYDPRDSVKKDFVDALTTAHTAKNATGAPVIDIAKRAMRWIW